MLQVGKTCCPYCAADRGKLGYHKCKSTEIGLCKIHNQDIRKCDECFETSEPTLRDWEEKEKIAGYYCDDCKGGKIKISGNIYVHMCPGVLLPIPEETIESYKSSLLAFIESRRENNSYDFNSALDLITSHIRETGQ